MIDSNLMQISSTHKSEDRKFSILWNVVIYISIAMVLFIQIVSNNGERYNKIILFTNLLISLISLREVFSNKSLPYSLYKIFHLFFVFFFGLAPSLQFKNRIALFGAPLLSEKEYLIGNFIVLTILLLYIIIYKNVHFKVRKWLQIRSNIVLSWRKLLFLSIFTTILYLWYRGFNFYSLLFREIEDDTRIVLSQSLSLIINSSLRPIPLICWYLYKIQFKKFNSVLEIFFVCLALLTCFPAGMARYQFAALYIPILLLYSRIFRQGLGFSLFFILGLVLIFPILNVFRFVSFGYNPIKAISINLFSDMLSGHYDSYQNFILVVNSGIITHGRQLLGVLFFWIPRAIWPSKPIGSGNFIAEEFNFSFDNVSMNFFGEGYVNFGIIGILLFTILISCFTKFLDYCYWKKRSNNFFYNCYPFLLGMLFFILRGDLLSSFAYTLGTLFSLSFVQYIVKC